MSTLTDPVADYLTRIRNAVRANHRCRECGRLHCAGGGNLSTVGVMGSERRLYPRLEVDLDGRMLLEGSEVPFPVKVSNLSVSGAAVAPDVITGGSS